MHAPPSFSLILPHSPLSSIFFPHLSHPRPRCLLLPPTPQVYERHGVITVEGWLAFRATADLARLLVALRTAVEEAFADKVRERGGWVWMWVCVWVCEVFNCCG